MNKISFAFCCVALIVGSYLFLAKTGSSGKVAYIEIKEVLNGYEEAIALKQEFEGKVEGWRINADSILKDWESELVNYEKERSQMTLKEKTLKEELLVVKQKQLNDYQKALQLRIQEEDRKNTELLYGKINQYLQVYGENHNYELILGANGSGNIMYGAELVNLTDEVVNGLNEQWDAD